MICRLFLDQNLQIGDSIDLPPELGHYLRQVMRLSTGDPVIIFNGLGGEYSGSITQLSKNYSSCLLESFADISRELSYHLHVIQAACRNDKIETVLQKGTELGATSFQIVRSERASLKLTGSKTDKRLDRWRRIIIEAAEQSGRTRIPELCWHDSLKSITACGLCFTLHPDTATPWHTVISDMVDAENISLAIGPEGGWSSRDIETLKACNFRNLTFGSRILRTETAAPSLLAAVQAVRHD